jgi:outer membrane protein insertion porin family
LRAALTAAGDPVGGKVLLTGNAELRFQLPFTADRHMPALGLNLGNFWGAFFADAGNVWTDYDETRKIGLFYGAGFGLRYNTPVGPVRFDFAKPILEREGQGPGHFYFAFGHLF